MIAGLQAMLSKWLEGEIINQAGKEPDDSTDKEDNTTSKVTSNDYLDSPQAPFYTYV